MDQWKNFLNMDDGRTIELYVEARMPAPKGTPGAPAPAAPRVVMARCDGVALATPATLSSPTEWPDVIHVVRAWLDEGDPWSNKADGGPARPMSREG